MSHQETAAGMKRQSADDDDSVGQESTAIRSSTSRRPSTPTPLDNYLHTLRTRYPSLSGRAALINWVDREEFAGYEIAIAKTIQDTQAFSVKILPPNDDLIFSRNNRHEIVAVSDSSKTLNGPPLQRIICNYGAGLQGYSRVVYYDSIARLKDNGALAVPAWNGIEYKKTYERRGDGAEINLVGKTMVTANQVVNLVLPPEDVRHLVRMLGIPTGSLTSILKALSNMRKGDTTYNITTLTDLEKVMEARNSTDLKQNHVALLESMEAGFLVSATTEEKVSAFCLRPSFQFIQQLKLQRPFSKPLYDANRKPVKKQALSSLPDDASVLMQDMTFDGGFYEKAFKSSMLVYTPGDYTIKVEGNKHRKQAVDNTMRASDLLRMIRAKEGASVPRAAVVVKNQEDEQADIPANLTTLHLDI